MILKEIIDMATEYDTINEIEINKILYYIACKHSKYGIIDKNNNIVLDLIYDNCKIWAETYEFIAFKQGNKYAIYSMVQKKFITDFLYENISYIFERKCFVVRKDNENMLIGTDGREIDFPVICQNNFINEVLSQIRVIRGGYPISNGKKVGAINTDGKQTIPYKYKTLTAPSEGLLVAVNFNDEQGYIDINDNVIIPFGKYSKCHSFKDGRAKVYSKEFGNIYIDKSGKEIETVKSEEVMIDKKILEKSYEHIVNGNPNVLKTGFDEMDKCLKNVDFGSLILISARPAMGKTALMLGIMYNLLKQGKSCLFFSQLNGMEYIIRRLLSEISEVPMSDINNSENLTQEQKEKLKQAKEELSTLNIVLFEHKFYIEQIKNKIENYTPEYVFIDNADLMDDFEGSRRIDTFSELKNIAQDNNCIIFTTCNLSKSIEEREDKRPMLYDLKETLKSYMVPDVVMFIYRDSYYNIAEEKDKNKAEIIIESNKNGCLCRFNLAYMNGKFYNLQEV